MYQDGVGKHQWLWRRLLWSGALLTLVGCSRDPHTLPLATPWDARSTLGEVHAAWNSSGEERAFANAMRLKEPQVQFRYRVDVNNRSGDKLFVRLANFQLAGGQGLEVAADTARIECTLAAGETPGVLAGELWVPRSQVDKIDGFRISALAVPLSDRGRARYRDWLKEGRTEKGADVEAELAQYAAAPACAAH